MPEIKKHREYLRYKSSSMANKKKWKVSFTVSGINDSEYDETVEAIELLIKEKGIAVHTGIGAESK